MGAMSARADFAKPIISSAKSFFYRIHTDQEIYFQMQYQTHCSDTVEINYNFWTKTNECGQWTLTFALTKETDTSSLKCTHWIIIQLIFGKTKSWVGGAIL